MPTSAEQMQTGVQIISQAFAEQQTLVDHWKQKYAQEASLLQAARTQLAQQNAKLDLATKSRREMYDRYLVLKQSFKQLQDFREVLDLFDIQNMVAMIHDIPPVNASFSIDDLSIAIDDNSNNSDRLPFASSHGSNHNGPNNNSLGQQTNKSNGRGQNELDPSSRNRDSHLNFNQSKTKSSNKSQLGSSIGSTRTSQSQTRKLQSSQSSSRQPRNEEITDVLPANTQAVKPLTSSHGSQTQKLSFETRSGPQRSIFLLIQMNNIIYQKIIWLIHEQAVSRMWISKPIIPIIP